MAKWSKVLRNLSCAFVISTALTPLPAQAEPITTTLFGAAFASSLGGVIVSSVIGTAASWLGAQVINWLFPPTGNETNSNTTPNPMEVTFGERVNRSGFFGVQPIGGHWVHANEYSNATQLQLIYILADGWIDGTISSVKVQGRAYDVTSVTPTNNAHREYRVDEFDNLIRIRVHDGRPGQAADTNMVAQTSGWDSNKKFSSMAYVAVEIESNRDKFNGIPELVFVTRGLKCYDPRKDSTASGGSGAHRFNDPTTWEYTKNPFVQAYHYTRGFYFNSFRVLGAGYAAAQLDYDSFIAAMNVADETVSIPGGGTRPRYECHMTFDDAEAFGSVMDRLCQAGGGHYSERQGRIAVYAGAARTSVMTITDDDIVDDVPYDFDPKVGGETLISAIQGTYTHPTDFYATPYTALYPSEFVYSGMEPRTQDVNFPQVQHPHQAYLLAKMMLYRWQLQANAMITLDIKDIELEVNDWITWTSSNDAVGTRVWQIVSTAYDFSTARVQLGLAEISADVYDDDSVAGDVVVPVRERPVTTYISAISGLQADPVNVTGSDGSRLPGLKFTYTPIFDAAITGIRFAYRVVGTTDPVKYVIDPSPNDGLYYASDFVEPGKRYEVNAQIIGIPGRTYDWLASWIEASADTSTFIATYALSAAFDNVNLDVLGDDIRNLIRSMNKDVTQLWHELQDLQYYVGDQDIGNQFQMNEIRQELSSEIDGVSASFSQVVTTIIAPINGQLQALVDAVTALNASDVEGNLNAARWRMVVATGPTGYSRIVLETKYDGADAAYRGASTFWDTPNNPLLKTRIINLADEFVLSDGTNLEAPFIFSGGVAVMNASRINVVEAGELRSFDGLMSIDLNLKRISISPA